MLPIDYPSFLHDLKSRIQARQSRIILAANRELIELYWEIGQAILNRQELEGWGAAVVTQLAKDLHSAFPEITGFSVRNLNYMRALAETYSDPEFVQQVVALLPWGHNIALLEKLKAPEERAWYAQQILQNGWSRNVLIHHLETKLYARQLGAVKTHNFPATLPEAQSDLMAQTLKDPYIFDFLTLQKDAKERDLERGLLLKLRDFMLELGSGFAFMGSQYPLSVSGRDYFLDLLFFHHRLRCLVVIELKMGEFEPEFAGKMNFYLSALDAQVKHADDRPSVGIILCRTKDRLTAEYALRDLHKPVGISTYRTGELPPEYHDFPSLETLQALLETGE
jgi:predicted nuclease of restriction endonuclease-like (RecB) superfamily